MEDKLVAVVKYPYEKSQTIALEKGLKPLQNIVGGTITGADLPDIEGVYGFANDEGLLIGLEPNIYRPEWKDALVGPLVFVGAGDEGEDVSLTREQVKKVTVYLNVNSVNDFGEFVYHVETDFAHYKPKKDMTMEVNMGYEIYQLKDNENPVLFLDYDSLATHGLKVCFDEYKSVYAGSENCTLNEIYERFNIDRPKDFYGHSLSVSDVIVLYGDDYPTAYYVDRFGFKELPNFFTDNTAKKKPDMQM